MTKPHKLFDKKTSLRAPKIKMLPKIRLFDPPHKNAKIGLTLWPENKERTDDRLPESE